MDLATYERTAHEEPVYGRKRGRRRTAGRVALLVVCAGVAVTLAGRYAGLDESAALVPIRPGVPFHFPVLLVHIACGTVALGVGALQFWPRLRRSRAHRTIGRVYLFAGVLPASAAGLCVAALSMRGLAAQTGFATLALLWAGTALAGRRAARRGDHTAHRQWMTRNFALTLAAVTLRVWLPILLLAGSPLIGVDYADFDHLFTAAYDAVAWLCWVPNLLVAGWYLNRRGRTGRR